MKKLDYKKVLYPAVITVLIVFFVGGVVLGGASVMHMEGSAPPYEPDSPFTALPETPEDAAALLNEALKDALNGKPKLVITSDCSMFCFLSRMSCFSLSMSCFSLSRSCFLNVPLIYINKEYRIRLCVFLLPFVRNNPLGGHCDSRRSL